MKRIAITPEAIHPAEPGAICAILDHGWDMVHLRHPGADIKSLRDLLDRIPAALHTRIRLHSCFELTGEYQLGGIHLNSRNPQPPPGFTGRISRSCHAISELQQSAGFDYVTLSPVFDSISKNGYRAAFTPEELSAMHFPDTISVIALGGINPENARTLRDTPFAGYAVLGYLSEAYGDSLLLEQRLKLFDSRYNS